MNRTKKQNRAMYSTRKKLIKKACDCVRAGAGQTIETAMTTVEAVNALEEEIRARDVRIDNLNAALDYVTERIEKRETKEAFDSVIDEVNRLLDGKA